MLGWRMEMELLGEQIGLFNVVIKKTDGVGGQEVVLSQVVVGLLGLLEWEEEGLIGLVELVGSLWIENLIVKIKFPVDKIFLDWNG
jgi:hypothetical protein